MTTATSATREQNIWLLREMFVDVKPKDLTDDELVAMLEILKAAVDRKQESLRSQVVYLDVVRSGQRRRRYR